MAVGDILQKYGIDNLGVDMDITRAILEIVQEKNAKVTPESITTALHKGMANASPCYEYPEDVRPYAEKVCELWHIKPPRKPRKSNERGEFSFWIISLRDLVDACGEYGADLIGDMRSDYEAEMHNNGGLAPFFVTGPSSLIKSARAKAAMKRQGITGIAKRGKPQQPVHQSTLDV
jgi:hypothetical protein